MLQIKKSIQDLITNANNRKVHVRGDAEELWFVIEGVRVDSRFTVLESDIMIKFENNSNNPTILIPQNVSIRPNAKITDCFIESTSEVEGWKSIFPGLFLDVNGELIELIFSVTGLLGNLSLYNLVSLESINLPDNEIIANFVDEAEEESQIKETNGNNLQSLYERTPPDIYRH